LNFLYFYSPNLLVSYFLKIGFICLFEQRSNKLVKSSKPFQYYTKFIYKGTVNQPNLRHITGGNKNKSLYTLKHKTGNLARRSLQNKRKSQRSNNRRRNLRQIRRNHNPGSTSTRKHKPSSLQNHRKRPKRHPHRNIHRSLTNVVGLNAEITLIPFFFFFKRLVIINSGLSK
jgi:hypothetical protein